ncbi:MAG: ankyrin repeat domain-containing protein [Rickettsiaceae bacterium]|nr:ankyrin repeat domain-containing protein [Rickettsiaceae bacterium]
MWPFDPMLRFAAENGWTGIAKFALFRGADVNGKIYLGKVKESVLGFAIKSQDEGMLDLVLEKMGDGVDCVEALEKAIHYSNGFVLGKVSSKISSEQCERVLRYIAKKGKYEGCALGADKEPHQNIRNSIGEFLVDKSSPDCLNGVFLSLLDNGWFNTARKIAPKMNLNLINEGKNYWKTLLMQSLNNSKKLEILILAGAGKSLNDTDNEGKTLLMHAANSLESMKFLSGQNGIDLNRKDNEGKTALMHAVIKGNNSVVEHLSKLKNIDLNLKDNEGKTALEYLDDSQLDQENVKELFVIESARLTSNVAKKHLSQQAQGSIPKSTTNRERSQSV